MMGITKTLFTEWQIWAEQQKRWGELCYCGPSPAEECPTHGYEAWKARRG